MCNSGDEGRRRGDAGPGRRVKESSSTGVLDLDLAFSRLSR